MKDSSKSKKMKYFLTAIVIIICILGAAFQIAYMYQIFEENTGIGSRIISNDSVTVNIKDVLPTYSEDEINYYLNKYYPNVDSATTYYRPMNDRKLIRNSDLIVRGTVKEILPAYETTESLYYNTIRYGNLNRNAVYHNVVIEVEEVYKGPSTTETITMKRIGGITETRVFFDMGTFDYRIGDEIVVYLKEIDNDPDGKIYTYTYPNRGELFVYENRYWTIEGKEYEVVY
jgi:hypothetical protein